MSYIKTAVSEEKLTFRCAPAPKELVEKIGKEVEILKLGRIASIAMSASEMENLRPERPGWALGRPSWADRGMAAFNSLQPKADTLSRCPQNRQQPIRSNLTQWSRSIFR